MKKFILYSLVLIGCVLSLSFITNATAVGIIVGAVSSILILYVDAVASNLDNLKYWWISARFRNAYIRISIAYLFRIKIDDQYLLVMGKRFHHFQPVGGVYKRYVSSTSFFSKIQALDDDLIPLDQTSKDDLRIRVKGKYLFAFIKWFNSGQEREVAAWREFYQELIETEILPQKLFPFIQYQYIRRYEQPLRYSNYARSQELIIADIYELIPTADQEHFLRQMIKIDSSYFVWADEDRIRRLGAIPKQEYVVNIAEHSYWIL